MCSGTISLQDLRKHYVGAEKFFLADSEKGSERPEIDRSDYCAVAKEQGRFYKVGTPK